MPTSGQTSPAEERPKAFVLMPFSPLMDQVYSALIKPALDAAGYVASRADSDLNQVAIMRDVVSGIQHAQLVVADMTGRNANVFYELGLAHGLQKPVILLAQSTADIPFDLGAYRTVIYEVTFLKAPLFRSTIRPQLDTLLAAVATGDIVFGSPFSDFGEPSAPLDTAEDGGEGILEVMARLQSELPGFLAHMAAITTLTESLGAGLTRATERLSEAAEGQELPHAIAVADELAVEWDQLAVEFQTEIDSGLAPMADLLERTAISAVRLAQLGTFTAQDAESLQPYRELAAASSKNATVTRSFAGTIRQISGITAKLRASGGRLSAVVDRIAVTSDRLARIADLIPGAPD